MPAARTLDDGLALAGLGLGHLLDDELLRLADALQDGGSHSGR